MTIEHLLFRRSGAKYELCAAGSDLSVYDVTPNAGAALETSVLVCSLCRAQLESVDDPQLWYGLKVKGTNFTAKRGTTVKNISLTDDAQYIEGKVNGTRIVLVAAYLKKA